MAWTACVWHALFRAYARIHYVVISRLAASSRPLCCLGFHTRHAASTHQMNHSLSCYWAVGVVAMVVPMSILQGVHAELTGMHKKRGIQDVVALKDGVLRSFALS